MKLRCPRCEKKLNVPDKFAGKAIRCPACNRGFKVPSPKAALGATPGGTELDLESLARLEAGTQEMTEEERVEAESTAATAAAEGQEAGDFRTCPHCNSQTRSEDPTVELLCSHCWKPIPATAGGGLQGKTRKGRVQTMTGPGGFYGELGSAVTYPLGVLSSILTAAGIALGAALVPVVVMSSAASLMEQSAVGTEEGVQAADLSTVSLILIMIFGAEVFFFSAVAIHSFFDVVRTTSVGNDAAPKLTFTPNQWGKSFVSYLILCAYFCVMTYVVATLTAGSDFIEAYVVKGDIKGMLANAGTPFVVGMVLVSVFIPMNLLGIGLGNITQALNPSNVLKSVGRTHVHYIFLVMILSVYGGIFGFAFFSILFDWFIPKIDQMQSGSTAGSYVDVLLPLVAWGAVMAFFFYGAYILARLHGLFARSFRKHLFFGTY